MSNQYYQLRDGLESQGDPSEDELPPLTPMPTIFTQFHIHPSSFKVQSKSRSVFTLSFQFDSTQDCTVTVRYFSSETRTGYLQTVPDLSPQVFQFRPGLQQEFPFDCICIDSSLHTPAILSFTDQQVYPVILEISSDKSDIKQTTFLAFRESQEVFAPKLLQQRLLIGEQEYEIKEVFNIPYQQQENIECSVCLTNKKDTVVYPCSHMCLCASCGNFLRTQVNKRCPICRTEVDMLVQITDDS